LRTGHPRRGGRRGDNLRTGNRRRRSRHGVNLVDVLLETTSVLAAPHAKGLLLSMVLAEVGAVGFLELAAVAILVCLIVAHHLELAALEVKRVIQGTGAAAHIILGNGTRLGRGAHLLDLDRFRFLDLLNRANLDALHQRIAKLDCRHRRHAFLSQQAERVGAEEELIEVDHGCHGWGLITCFQLGLLLIWWSPVNFLASSGYSAVCSATTVVLS